MTDSERVSDDEIVSAEAIVFTVGKNDIETVVSAPIMFSQPGSPARLLKPPLEISFADESEREPMRERIQRLRGIPR